MRVRYTTIHAADDDLNDAAYHISHSTPAVAFDADAALAAAHGLLRHPERFGLTTDVRPKALRVNVAVNEAAFMALAERFSDADTWDGIAPFVLSALPQHHDDEDERYGPYGIPLPRAHHVHLGAAIRLRANFNGTEVQMRFRWAMEETPLRSGQKRSARVAERLSEIAGVDVAARRHREVELWTPAYIERPPTQAAAAPAVALADRRELLGEDRCDHELATWRTAHPLSNQAMPYQHLSCSRCLRTQVATVPLHRRCADQIADPEAYVQVARAQAAADGDYLPEHITLADLVERDRHLSVNPTDYATKPRPLRSAPAPARRGFAGIASRTRR